MYWIICWCSRFCISHLPVAPQPYVDMKAVSIRNSKHIRKMFVLKLLLRARGHFARAISGRKIYKLYTSTPLKFSTRRQPLICSRTGRARGVLRLFGFSRFIAKRYLDVGEFPGMHRSSW